MRSRREARGRSWGRCSALPAIVAVLGAAPAARADGTEPIRITVSAPPGCTDTEAFTAEVTARTAKARPAAAGEAARSFTVTITASGKKARGTLIIEDPHGPGGARDVSGASCAEVASALALVTALAIDPKASTAAKPPPPPPKPPPAPKPVELPREPKQLPPYAPLPWWGPIGAPLPAVSGPSRPMRWRIAAAVHAGAMSAFAPAVTLVASGGVEVARVDGGLLSPAFRLTLLTADSGDDEVGQHLRARYRLIAARVDGCPIRFAIVGPLAVYPCVHFEGGALGAAGLSPFVRGGTLPEARRRDTTRPWLAPGFTGRMQIDVLDELLVELQGGVNFPLVRDTFYFGQPPSTTRDVNAHQVPIAGGFVSAGVGMHFP